MLWNVYCNMCYIFYIFTNDVAYAFLAVSLIYMQNTKSISYTIFHTRNGYYLRECFLSPQKDMNYDRGAFSYYKWMTISNFSRV